MQVQSSLIVLFEEPFWVGLYERSCDGAYEVCKIIFGAEPNEPEIYKFLLENWSKLHFASTDLTALPTTEKRVNPKRVQRQINKQMQTKTLSTKAQQALQQQRDNNKLERKVYNKQIKEAEQERRFLLRQAKRKAKHRGR